MDRDRFLTVFDRFDEPAMHNLVCPQSELYGMKAKFDLLNSEETQGNPPFNWDDIKENIALSTAKVYEELTHAQQRFFLIKEIRQTMAEYRETLLQQARFNELDSSIARTLESIYSVKQSQVKRRADFQFPDFMEQLYDQGKIQDTVSLRSPVVQDPWVSCLNDSNPFRLFLKARATDDPFDQCSEMKTP